MTFQPPTGGDTAQPTRERRVSRFQVSLVSEQADKSKGETSEYGRKDSTISTESETRREADFATVINTTFDSLKTTLVKSWPTGSGK